ncbi:MAG: hypothetical protein SPK70_06555 [Succinivibrio dextrinosolvens]|nr:hypothetical protein [Succinivibrio dextrinosolvens]MDY6470709.1 hypothetical protein [Succinivibrio dextrinosolvens]
MKEIQTKKVLFSRYVRRDCAPVFLTSIIGILVVLCNEAFEYLHSLAEYYSQDQLINIGLLGVISQSDYFELLYIVKVVITLISLIVVIFYYNQAISSEK